MKKLIATAIASVTLCIAASGAFAQSWILESAKYGNCGVATRTRAEAKRPYTWTFAFNDEISRIASFNVVLSDYHGGIFNFESMGSSTYWTTLQLPGRSNTKDLMWFGWPKSAKGSTFTFQTNWSGTDLQWGATDASSCCFLDWKPMCGTLSTVPEPGSILAACSILGPVGFVFRRRKK